MDRLSHRGIYLTVFVLQAIACGAVALTQWHGAYGAVAWLTCLGVFAATIRVGALNARRAEEQVARLEKWVSLLAVVVGGGLLVAGRVGFVALALLLIAARNLTLTKRRALYFDSAIVLTVFFNALGNLEGAAVGWVGLEPA